MVVSTLHLRQMIHLQDRSSPSKYTAPAEFQIDAHDAKFLPRVLVDGCNAKS